MAPWASWSWLSAISPQRGGTDATEVMHLPAAVEGGSSSQAGRDEENLASTCSQQQDHSDRILTAHKLDEPRRQPSSDDHLPPPVWCGQNLLDGDERAQGCALQQQQRRQCPMGAFQGEGQHAIPFELRMELSGAGAIALTTQSQNTCAGLVSHGESEPVREPVIINTTEGDKSSMGQRKRQSNEPTIAHPCVGRDSNAARPETSSHGGDNHGTTEGAAAAHPAVAAGAGAPSCSVSCICHQAKTVAFPSPGPKAPWPPGASVHPGVACDICDAFPIRGPRYKSLLRSDYDLCEQCWLRHHQHQGSSSRPSGTDAHDDDDDHHHHCDDDNDDDVATRRSSNGGFICIPGPQDWAVQFRGASKPISRPRSPEPSSLVGARKGTVIAAAETAAAEAEAATAASSSSASPCICIHVYASELAAVTGLNKNCSQEQATLKVALQPPPPPPLHPLPLRHPFPLHHDVHLDAWCICIRQYFYLILRIFHRH